MMTETSLLRTPSRRGREVPWNMRMRSQFRLLGTEEGPGSAQNTRYEGNYKYKKDRPYDYKKPRGPREGGDRVKKHGGSQSSDILTELSVSNFFFWFCF